MQQRPPNLIVGVGNILRGDDGFGVEVVTRMAGLPLPAAVEVFDAGTAGLDLAATLEDRELVLILDAIDAGGPPGTVYRLSPEQLRPATGSGLSVHDLHLLHALDETRLLDRAPRRVVVFAVQVEDISTGIRLSPPLLDAVPRVIALAAAELGISISEGQLQSTSARAGGATAADRADSPSTEVMSWS